jgi:hypothetical protein
MSLSLGQKQELFARCHYALLGEAFRLGYDVRQKELLRGEQQARWNAAHCGECRGDEPTHGGQAHPFKPIGILASLHRDGLAIDLVLVKNDAPLWTVGDYRPLGLYWESLDPLCYWGGDSSKEGDRLIHDGVHFSITHQGRQ